MADKPTDYPDWATTQETDPVSGQSNRVEPPSDKKDSGWDRREIPPRQWLNWLMWVFSQWVRWVDAGTSSATADTLVERDANGRAQVASPSVAADAANKGYVDTGDSDTLSSAQSYTDAAVDDLSGVTDAAGARTNLDVYSTGEADAAFLDEASNLNDLPDKAAARSNLGLTQTATLAYYSQRVTLGGDFDAGMEVQCERVGDTVTITGVGILTGTSGTTIDSASGAIPAEFRPPDATFNIHTITGGETRSVLVNEDGLFRISHYDSTNSLVSGSTSGSVPSISYVVT